jgi:hypothetical protein
MKRRFRQLQRQGWHIIQVPRMNMWHFNTHEPWGNEEHYKMLREWCHENIAKGEWESTMVAEGTGLKPGTKRFCFKDPEAKLMFALRWGF